MVTATPYPRVREMQRETSAYAGDSEREWARMSVTGPGPAGSSRGNPPMGDIVRSVAVLGMMVIALWVFGRFFTATPDSPVKAIDYVSVVDSARPAADFALLAPARLPEGWKATSARFTERSWHLGVLTDDEEYIGLEQTKTGMARTVDRFAGGSTSAGSTRIGGQTWRVRTGPDGDTVFVRREAGLTSLVRGTAPRAVVDAYVSSLAAG